MLCLTSSSSTPIFRICQSVSEYLRRLWCIYCSKILISLSNKTDPETHVESTLAHSQVSRRTDLATRYIKKPRPNCRWSFVLASATTAENKAHKELYYAIIATHPQPFSRILKDGFLDPRLGVRVDVGVGVSPFDSPTMGSCYLPIDTKVICSIFFRFELFSQLQKRFCQPVRTPVQSGHDNNYRSTSYCSVERQKLE